MNLNATCVVQIFNFIITYIILKRVLLTPFVARMHKKMAARQKMLAALNDGETTIGKLNNAKIEHLDAFKVHINATYQRPTPVVTEQDTLRELPLNPAETKNLIASTTKLLIEKIPHVS